jgi:DNA phosphorothioation-dependent restriction protein DptG
VFLNDKNRKDIESLNLTRSEFFYFFKEKVLSIYKKSSKFNIPVDFSPFLSDLVSKDNEFIINNLENGFLTFEHEIENFFN